MKFSDCCQLFLSIPKTLRFNLHYFPLKVALRLPVVVSHRTYLRELHGEVELPETLNPGMVRIGFGDVGHYDRRRSRTIWQVSGKVSFHGKTSIGHGSKISVRGHLELGSDFNITAESTIVCAKEICFGNDCLVSWDVLVMDTDEHPIFNAEQQRINPDAPIRVGNHVWIGCKCLLLKGSKLSDNTVVAAGTVCHGSVEGENQIIGGQPVKVLKKEVFWNHQ